MRCPNCLVELDTTDWTECFTFNDEIFEIECSFCDNNFMVKVDITPTYEVVEE